MFQCDDINDSLEDCQGQICAQQCDLAQFFESNPFSSLEALEMPVRQMTFYPSAKASPDDKISVDYPTQRILFQNLSFDHVVMSDGYIVPCELPQHHDTPKDSGSSEPCHGEDKAHQSVDVTLDVQTEASWDHEEFRQPEQNEESNTLSSKSDRQQINSSSKSRNCLNVERNIKKLLRLLRKWIKRQFDSFFKKKHYYWDDETLRNETRRFFTELSTFEIPLEFYTQN